MHRYVLSDNLLYLIDMHDSEMQFVNIDYQISRVFHILVSYDRTESRIVVRNQENCIKRCRKSKRLFPSFVGSIGIFDREKRSGSGH